MKITEESIRDQIPYYLTQEAKENLVKALNAFPKNNYYINCYSNEVLQGDGWTSLELFDFESGEKKAVKGIIISNSCDISPENKRTIPTKISFAPVIRLDNYIDRLKENNKDAKSIEAKVISIKNQQVSNILYLPKCENLEFDSIAILYELHTIPLSHFLKNPERSKIFTLSQVGFYLFLMKISIHFCRFHEALDRND